MEEERTGPPPLPPMYPQSRSNGLGTGERILFNTSQSTQDAYDKCAVEVVTLLRCVQDKGPTWFWACGDQYITLQRCYDAEKQKGRAGSMSISDGYQAAKRTVAGAWGELGRWMTAVLHGKQ